MNSKQHGPSYWLLYLSLPAMIGLLLIQHSMALSETGHTIAELVIVLVIFRLISLWLNANSGAIIYEDMEKRRKNASSMSPQPVKPALSNENSGRSSRPMKKPFYGHLAGWISSIFGLLHF